MKKILSVMVFGLLLSGCGSFTQNTILPHDWGNPETYEALAKAPRTGNAFTKALADGYQSLSEYERDNADWRDHERWARKGLLAAEGIAVHPELPERWDLDGPNWSKRTVEASYQELYQIREEMIETFYHCGAPTKRPVESAAAQVAFDCWVEELEEGWETPRIEECKNTLLDNLGKIMAVCPPPPAPPAAGPEAAYDVFFGFDRSGLDDTSAILVEKIAEAAGKTGIVTLAGWTDTMGNADYNLRLSKKRVDSVRAALIKAGVPARNIVSESAKGETELPKMTGDQVAEQANRVVHITLDHPAT